MAVIKNKLKVSELELILSKRIRNVLGNMEHQIAKDLMDTHRNSEPIFKKTFVDLGSESDMISFIQSSKVPELIDQDIVHGKFIKNKDYKLPSETETETDEQNFGDFDIINCNEWINPWIQDTNHIIDLHEIQFTEKSHQVWNKNRSEIKIRRFITQLFPNRYETNVKRLDRGKLPSDIETFGNMFVASVEETSKKIVSVKGEDIRHYYDNNNYFECKGSIGSSCMNSSEKSEQLDIYVKNPEKVSMLILYPEDIRDKIIGRAILWKLDTVNGVEVEDAYLMDRIYTTNESDEFMFMNYAKAHGYYYKTVQSYGYDYPLYTPDGKQEIIKLGITLKPIDFNDKYPYVDTMQFYDTKTGHITNDRDNYENDKYGIMTDYMGPIEYDD